MPSAKQRTRKRDLLAAWTETQSSRFQEMLEPVQPFLRNLRPPIRRVPPDADEYIPGPGLALTVVWDRQGPFVVATDDSAFVKARRVRQARATEAGLVRVQLVERVEAVEADLYALMGVAPVGWRLTLAPTPTLTPARPLPLPLTLTPTRFPSWRYDPRSTRRAPSVSRPGRRTSSAPPQRCSSCSNAPRHVKSSRPPAAQRLRPRRLSARPRQRQIKRRAASSLGQLAGVSWLLCHTSLASHISHI